MQDHVCNACHAGDSLQYGADAVRVEHGSMTMQSSQAIEWGWMRWALAPRVTTHQRPQRVSVLNVSALSQHQLRDLDLSDEPTRQLRHSP